MIYVYGDDGADEKQERVAAVSALGGTEEQWRMLEDKWISRCNGIPFHAKDCESDQGDYRGIPHDENKAMYRDLVAILANSGICGIAIAIDLSAQMRVFPNSPRISYYRAFEEVLQKTAAAAERVGNVAKLTFDISIDNEYNAAYLYNVILKGSQRLRDWLDPEISFVPAKKSARVQTGDMLAYEGWKVLDHTVGPIKRARKSWEALRNTGRFETFSYSTDWFNDLKKHIDSGELAERVGFESGAYREWLKKKGRQDNISNMFEFMSRMGIWDERNDAPV